MGGGAQAVMGAMGSGCKCRWSFASLPTPRCGCAAQAQTEWLLSTFWPTWRSYGSRRSGAAWTRCAVPVPQPQGPQEACFLSCKVWRCPLTEVSLRFKIPWLCTTGNYKTIIRATLSLILGFDQNIAWKKKVNVNIFRECLDLRLLKKEFPVSHCPNKIIFFDIFIICVSPLECILKIISIIV